MPIYTTNTAPSGYLTSGQTGSAIDAKLVTYTGTNVDPLVKVATVSLTAAEIKALNATPKQLIAAPGSGKSLIVERVHFRFNWVGVQYTAGSALSVIYAGGSTNLLAGTLAASFLTAPTAAVTNDAIIGSLNTQLTVPQETAVNLKAASTEFATGNGTLDVTIWYRMR